MKYFIPKKVEYIIRKLNNFGYECYLVGGAVRDIVLGIEPKDYDLCTDALPQDVEQIFNKTIPTGKDYGTITVIIDDEPFEVTTFRLECDYDGRRPKVVEFAKTLKEDLARRDLTINAMAMDIDGEVIDFFNGFDDLKNGVIRTVGNPKERFMEDGLRMIRTIRFATRFNYRIDEKTYKCINGNVHQLSKERLREELNKILVTKRPSIGIRMIMDKGFAEVYGLGELKKGIGFNQSNPHHDKDIFEHTMKVIDNIPSRLELRLAALLHDIGKPLTFSVDENNVGHFYKHHRESARICKEIMLNLKYSNKEIEHVSKLVYCHMMRYEEVKAVTAKRFINKIGVDLLDDIFELFIADRSSTSPPYKFDDIYRLKFECERVIKEKQPLSVKDLNINGKDLMKMGIPQGKVIGDILKELLKLVLEYPELNQKDKLLEKVKLLK